MWEGFLRPEGRLSQDHRGGQAVFIRRAGRPLRHDRPEGLGLPGPIGANPADTGRIVKIRGQVSEFKGAPQLTAGRIRMADGNDQYDVSALVPVAPIDPDERLQEIRRLIDSMEDADYQSVARTMLERHLEAFRSIPAAKSVHHSFLSGLLMHTSNMLRLADYLSGLYAGIIDRSLLLTGTLLHDFAKEREFTFSGLGMVTDYSLSGQLIGHLVMGAQEPRRAGLRRGRAPHVRRGGAVVADRPGRQPHGDLRRGPAGAAGGHVLRPYLRAGQKDLPPSLSKPPPGPCPGGSYYPRRGHILQ